jgi:hypothetical protein
MSNTKTFSGMLVLLLILLVACGPTTELPGAEEQAATATPGVPPIDSDADAIAGAASAFLAQYLAIAENEIEVVSIEPTEFSDSCLGLGQPHESCLQAITPGWLVILTAEGQTYEAHTDQTGQEVRVATDPVDDDGAADTAAAAAQEFLVSELGVGLGDVQVISAEMAEFSDSCLGLGRPDESCLQVMTPGWLIIVNVQGQVYEVHTDETGQQVRVAGE